MTANGPLSGLRDIDWAGLKHAYGPAADVPDLLDALLSADRDEAIYALYGTIFHQGSRYEATAYAVPFLAAMAVDDTVPGRGEILQMLATLAIGYDEGHLPAGVDTETWRAQTARIASADRDDTLRQFDEWVADSADDRTRRSREFRRMTYDFDAQRDRAIAELATYDAVRAQILVLRGLLRDPDADVRAATTYVLGWFPEEAELARPALLDLLAGETNAGVTANAIVAAGLLGAAPPRERLTDQVPAVRWAAAIALARRGDTSAEVIGELAVCAARQPPQTEPAVLYQDGDLQQYAAASLGKLGADAPSTAIAAVLDGLAGATAWTVPAITAVALRLAFGPPGESAGAPGESAAPYTDLSPLQRRCLHVLAELDAIVWHSVDFSNLLRTWGLPEDRATLHRYLTASLPADLRYWSAASPCRYAYATACARSRAPIFGSRWLMWLFTVASLTTSRAAMSVFDRPSAIRASTSASRTVRPSGSEEEAAADPDARLTR